MLEKLLAAHAAGQLQFFGQHSHLAKRTAFTVFLAPLRKIRWYVYDKRPFAGPEAVLAYPSRYTHRVAIANSRLIAFAVATWPLVRSAAIIARCHNRAASRRLG
jgi:hypothetical protein